MLSPESSIKWHPFSIRNVLRDQLEREDAGGEVIEGKEEENEDDVEDDESRAKPCEILKRRRLQYESRRILLSENGGGGGDNRYRICHLKRRKLILSADGEGAGGGGGNQGDIDRTGGCNVSNGPEVDVCVSAAEPEVDVENVGNLDLTSDDDVRASDDDESAACRRNCEGGVKDDDVINQPG